MSNTTHASGGHAHAHAHAHEGVGHVAPTRALLGTGIALLILTWITVSAARVDLGEMNIYIALGIACLKGSLVALFFMHLRWDRPFNAIVFVSSLCFVALFLAFAMTDSAEYLPDIKKGDAPNVVLQVEATAKQIADAAAAEDHEASP